MVATAQIRLVWSDPVTEETFDQTVPLPATLGRSPENTVVLPSERVSRQHAAIESEGGVIVLTDRSTNGTLVNGTRMPRAALGPGDSIEIGPFTLNVLTDATVPRTVTLQWAEGGVPRRDTFVLPLTVGRGTDVGLVLNDSTVSRRHASFDAMGNDLVVTNLSSTSGTLVNGAPIMLPTIIHPGDTVQVGESLLTTEGAAMRAQMAAPPGVLIPAVAYDEAAVGMVNLPGGHGEETQLSGTRVVDVREAAGGYGTVIAPPGTAPVFPALDDRTVLTPVAQPLPSRASLPPIFDQPVIPAAALGQIGIPVYTCTYAALGAGIGSFVFVENLLIYGVPKDAIISLGSSPIPYLRYSTYCRNSQIPTHERLRSNSESTPDNIWGTPGYAARESWESIRKGEIGNGIRVLWQVFGEPTVAQTYTPRSGDVFRAMENEMRRIDWGHIYRHGLIRAIRKTDDGRYAVLYSTGQGQQRERAILVANYVQLSLGYPALRFLPVLQEYRERTGDVRRVANAYEFHDHVYEQLERQGGTIIVQGRGIVASRLIQRVYEARKKNRNIVLLHVMRTPTPEPHRFKQAKRALVHHVEIQPFNWPKGAWGGEQRLILARASSQEREKILEEWGGTTTAQRADWVKIIDVGIREGWYRAVFGEFTRVDQTPDGRVVAQLIESRKTNGTRGAAGELVADFILDAVGLEASVKDNPLLKDLVENVGAQQGYKGRLAVTNAMEVVGMRNGTGRMYAAGSMTLGGPLAGADSFLGLQGAAQLSLEDLVRLKAPGVKALTPLRSFGHWLKWMRGKAI